MLRHAHRGREAAGLRRIHLTAERLRSRGYGKNRRMTKNEKVPPMTDVKPNREQRRHPEQQPRPENEPISRDEQLVDQDVEDPRAKNSGHGKKTADKWNQ